MNILNNLDLFSVGMVIAAIGILGFVLYFNNTKSITNRTFLYLSITIIFWSIFNYLVDQISLPNLTLWILRLVMFFAVWFAFYLFKLAYVFPKEKYIFSNNYRWILVPIVIIISITTLTPLVFKEIIKISLDGKVEQVTNGFGIFTFASLVVFLLISSVFIFVKKTFSFTGQEKKQSRFVLIGFTITFFLLIIFNFIFPAFFDNSNYIKFGALFIFPFIAFTSYAILKHKLFDVKIIATATLAFALSIVTFFEIIFSEGFSQILFRSSVFILVLIFSVFLLKSVSKEVAQREQIQRLADNLEKANVRLKELDRLKSEFVSFATHQIRAPLTAIKGYTSLIIEGSYGKISKEVKGAIDKIYQSSQSLVLVVEDYLNISRIEMGNMKYDFAIKDFDKLLRQIAEELMPNIKKTGLDFFLNIDESKEYKSNIDEGKIKQVIINLIDNAIKYTKEGSITVSLSKNEERKKLLVTVSDTGIGISKETMPKLFSKFIRAKNSHEVNIHGTGLGLYIAKQMTEAHKSGKLWVESEGEGKGSKFFVELDAV